MMARDERPGPFPVSLQIQCDESMQEIYVRNFGSATARDSTCRRHGAFSAARLQVPGFPEGD